MCAKNTNNSIEMDSPRDNDDDDDDHHYRHQQHVNIYNHNDVVAVNGIT